MGKVKNSNSLPFRVYMQHNHPIFTLYYRSKIIGNILVDEMDMNNNSHKTLIANTDNYRNMRIPCL